MNSLIQSLAVAIDILNKRGKIYIVQRGTKDYRIDIEPLKKADLIIVFNPWDNQNLILEAHRRAIPIIAQTDIYSQSPQSGNHSVVQQSVMHNAKQIRKYITYPVSILSLELLNSYIQFLYRFEKKKTKNKVMHKMSYTKHRVNPKVAPTKFYPRASIVPFYGGTTKWDKSGKTDYSGLSRGVESKVQNTYKKKTN